ncbi:serine hydrolase domain-containing protein [Steroidobacter flavus]|uniref:Serine hydrolase domain-containing protein n=1 Tax=Steroidobacter flavus TaxID=1842136 RepID=A0ABV8SWR5_9GAMM
MGTFDRRAFLQQAGWATMALGMGATSLRVLADAGATPEASGVSSQAIRAFLDAVAGSNHEMHSLMVVRHGRNIAQGWWRPYRADTPQTLYSLSKSFTSTAVGLAVADGKLKVTDRVIDFFPDRLPASVSDNLKALRIQHLLTMSAGHAVDTAPLITREQDWVKAFLALPVDNVPGSAFVYNSGATYMLSAIVQKVTGEKLIDYLRPRLFEPLQLQVGPWSTCPRGINTGGWGLSATTEALARFGRLYLQQGRWGGKQLLPKSWVQEATTFKIQQPATAPGTDLAQLKQSSDWHQGYAYQFWRCRHDAFRGDGAFGQYCIVLPKQDAVIALTSATTDMQGLINLVWLHLLPGMQDQPLPADVSSSSKLQEQLAALALPLPSGSQAPPTSARINGRSFELESNSLGAKSVALRFERDICKFELATAAGRFDIDCGLGRWSEGTTSMPGTPPEISELIGPPVGEQPPVKVAAAGVWKDPNTFQMQWRFYGTPHHDVVTCRFDGERVQVEFKNSITALTGGGHPETRPILTGRA